MERIAQEESEILKYTPCICGLVGLHVVHGKHGNEMNEANGH
jgi:hypothetical protein